MDVLERFLRYVQINTQSDDSVVQHPSSKGQWILAEMIAEELKTIGVESVRINEFGMVFGKISSNMGDAHDKNIKKPVVGLVGHLDTFPGFSGENVKPLVHKLYDGGVITLDNGIELSPETFSELKNYIGQDIITANGFTLLGANGKAGLAEIMCGVERLIREPEILHGEVRVLITPDQETVQRGIELLKSEEFPVDVAITMDGDGLGEVSFENFNAATAIINIKGRQVFTGKAKNLMINALKIGAEWISYLPEQDSPENTEGYEGFIHFEQFDGTVEQASIVCMLRDFEMDGLMQKKRNIIEISERLNQKYGIGTIEVSIIDEYANMRSALEYKPQIVKCVMDGLTNAGVLPKVVPIRGCSDGAYLAKMGIPAPNLFTGGHNCHGPYEFIPIPSMEMAVNSLLCIVAEYAKSELN